MMSIFEVKRKIINRGNFFDPVYWLIFHLARQIPTQAGELFLFFKGISLILPTGGNSL